MTDIPVSAINVAPHSLGGWTIGVVAKRTYLAAWDACQVAPEQAAIVESPILAENKLTLIHDSDLVLNRSAVDVIVEGYAHAPHHQSVSFDASLTIGEFTRSIRVFGDRRCEADAYGRCRFTDPLPVEKVPLDWAHAYGGYDRAAIEKYGDPVQSFCVKAGVEYRPQFGFYAYPRNPVGKGYLIDGDLHRSDPIELPNLEEPRHLLTPATLPLGDFRFWPRCPLPTSLGWLPYGFFPRSAQAGFPTRPFHFDQIPLESFIEVGLGALSVEELRKAALPGNAGAGLSQGSALGMRLFGVVADSSIKLTNLHPRYPEWWCRLKAAPPTLYLRLPEQAPIALTPQIRTLLLQPDQSRVVVLWVGEERLTVRPTLAHFQQAQHAVLWND